MDSTALKAQQSQIQKMESLENYVPLATTAQKDAELEHPALSLAQTEHTTQTMVQKQSSPV